MTTAMDKLKAEYMTESELASLLGVELKVIRDRRSKHRNGHARFINHISPSTKCHLYHITDVLDYLKKQFVQTFNVANIKD